MKLPSISIIIPIYNTEKFIRRCIETILHQTFTDFELILVNDGSTDSSLSICKEYAISDSRVKLIDKSNGGVSSARNQGIDASKGEYICFVDSDDYVDPDYLQSMIDAVEKSHADIVIQGLKQMKDNIEVSRDLFEDEVLIASDLTNEQFDDIFYYCGPYCKLFKASVIKKHNIYFPVSLSYGEDAVFYHTYLENCKVIELLSSAAYNYMIANQNALSTKTLSPDKFWQNQSNRRNAYRNLKKTFGLPQTLSEKEQNCKIIAIGGMLSSIFKSGADGSTVCRYLDMMVQDEGFKLTEIVPDNLYHKFILHHIKSNGKLNRWILKSIFR